MSKLLFELIFCSIGLFCCWHFTKAPEMRRTRWLKLGISAPLFYLIARVFAKTLTWGGGEMSLGDAHVFFLILLLAIIWTSNISWSAGTAFTNFLDGQPSFSEGMQPEYRFAKSQLHEGNLEEALKLTLMELKKHPKDYEGRMIASSICQELNRPGEAMPHLKTVLDNPAATDAQKDAARGEFQVCELSQRQIEIRKLNESR